MIRAAILVALLGALALPATAGAQFALLNTIGIYGDHGDRLLRQTQAHVTVSGELVIDFASDEATCAAVGRCGVRGTLVWRPAREGRFFIFDVRKRDGRRTVEPAFYLEEDAHARGPGVLTQVRRARAGGGTGVCSDATEPVQTFDVRASRGQLVFGVSPEGNGPLTTRCAGPLWDDLRSVLPRPRIDLAALRRRGGVADLAAQQAFAAAGLRGTVRSTIRARIARPVADDDDEGGRTRVEDEPDVRVTAWRITRATGSVRVRVQGAAEASRCGGLDACGLDGTLTVAPRPRDGEVSFSTSGAPIDGARAGGAGGWTAGGTVTASLARPAEAAPCTDAAALTGGALLLAERRGTVTASYAPLTGISTRCGGPSLGFTMDPFVTGRVPARALRGREPVTIRLDRGVDRTAEGFRISTTSDLTLTLERQGS